MASFSTLPTVARLKKLAKQPVDLTKELSADRVKRFQKRASGVTLLYGTERVTEEVVEALKELAKESNAVKKMQRMQSGEIVNEIKGFPSEKRAALHTAMRALFEGEPLGEGAAKATKQEEKELEKLKLFLEKIENSFTTLVMIGIGGSNLGPEAACRALAYLNKPGREIYFVANVDPDEATSVLKKIDKKRTLVLIVSKSGSTMETETNHIFFRREFEKAGVDPKKHFVAMTGEGSPLDDKELFLECFYSWDFIGGRYCTTALYGAIPLGFMIGLDHFYEFLKGAHEMDVVALNEDPEKNLPLFLALISIWNRNFLDHPTMAMIPYCSALNRLPAHIQQVEMESNGKQIDKEGKRVDFETAPIIWGEPGDNAQHSFYQMLHQGTSIVPMELIGFKRSQYEHDQEIDGTTGQEKLDANLFAQAIALSQGMESDNPNKRFEGNRPVHILFMERLTPYALGTLFSLMENRVAFEGFIWNINSFDQEGVQLGKRLAVDILTLIEAKKQHKEPKKSFPLGSAFLDFML